MLARAGDPNSVRNQLRVRFAPSTPPTIFLAARWSETSSVWLRAPLLVSLLNLASGLGASGSLRPPIAFISCLVHMSFAFLMKGSAYGAKSQAEFRSTALTRARCTAVSSIRHVDGPSPHVMGWMQHPFRRTSASRTPISELRVLDTHATEPASD